MDIPPPLFSSPEVSDASGTPIKSEPTGAWFRWLYLLSTGVSTFFGQGGLGRVNVLQFQELDQIGPPYLDARKRSESGARRVNALMLQELGDINLGAKLKGVLLISSNR